VVRRAARVDKPQAAIVKALRGYGCAVTHLHMAGDGIPDLLISIKGADGKRRWGLGEVKDGEKPPSRRELTDDQKDFWKLHEGAPMAILTDETTALRFARLLAFGDS
jgi:hypothetical protein